MNKMAAAFAEMSKAEALNVIYRTLIDLIVLYDKTYFHHENAKFEKHEN